MRHAINKHNKHFRAARKNQYFRLVHVPSGDYVQRHLCDFLMHKDALDCRDRMIAAAPDWDWGNPTFVAEMPTVMFDRVWASIYRR
jgi:hypothetical protein